MLSHRKSRRESLNGFANETKSYRWVSEREAGFEECSLRFDQQGRLIAVDFEIPPKPPAEIVG
jgi:hypothetical protein